MPLGPVEWVEIAFPGTTIDPKVVPPLARLIDSGVIRVLDLLVVTKAADGTVSTQELDELGEEVLGALDALDGDVLGLLSPDDAALAGDRLSPETCALLVVWENRWATDFAQSVQEAGGAVLAHDRIPAADVQAAAAAAGEEGSA